MKPLGVKKESRLARFDLIPPEAEWALAEHYGRNVGKYEARNWERGTQWSPQLRSSPSSSNQILDGRGS